MTVDQAIGFGLGLIVLSIAILAFWVGGLQKDLDEIKGKFNHNRCEHCDRVFSTEFALAQHKADKHKGAKK